MRLEDRELITRDGPPVHYDALLLALGAQPRVAVPGALTFAGPRDVAAVRDALEALDPGRRHVVAFVAGTGVAWTLPLYELALMTAEYGRRQGLDLRIELVTRESEPLDIFGAEASAAVAGRLAAAGVQLRAGTFAQEYDDGRLWLELEGPLDVDLAVALPLLEGPAVDGLPVTEGGFIPVDAYSRVRGVEHVWAAGDMTSRPIKHGGLTAQQADVAAADIAARVAGSSTPVASVPSGSARAPAHGRRPGLPRAPARRALALGGLVGVPVVAGAQGRRPPPGAVSRAPRGSARLLSRRPARRATRRPGAAQPIWPAACPAHRSRVSVVWDRGVTSSGHAARCARPRATLPLATVCSDP